MSVHNFPPEYANIYCCCDYFSIYLSHGPPNTPYLTLVLFAVFVSFLCPHYLHGQIGYIKLGCMHCLHMFWSRYHVFRSVHFVTSLLLCRALKAQKSNCKTKSGKHVEKVMLRNQLTFHATRLRRKDEYQSETSISFV